MTVDDISLRNLAEFRATSYRLRWALYGVCWLWGLINVAGSWAVICMTIVMLADLTEIFTARRVVAREGTAGFARAALLFRIGNALTASALAFTICCSWVLSEPVTRTFALSLLFAGSLFSVLAQQVWSMLMIRQIILFGSILSVLIFEVLVLKPENMTAHANDIAAVGILGLAAMMISHVAAKTYRDLIESQVELARARDDANEANQAKSRFIAMISHEIRTPLNGILGMASNLGNGSLEPEQRRQVEIIGESGHALAEIVNDVLDLTQIESGKMRINRAPTNLGKLLAGLRALYGTLAVDKGVNLIFEGVEQLPEKLSLDEVRLRQCLSNLISNALKFTEIGEVRVAISCEPVAACAREDEPAVVTITVADTGIGISAAGLAKLFAPFSQADESIGRRFGGTGLGLNITRQLIDAMGGEIHVSSVLDQGSTFTITLPTEICCPHAMADTEAGETHGPEEFAGRGLRVLVVDDVETNRTVMSLFLAPLGIEVTTASDGGEALDALRRTQFDAALIDLHLPDMLGVEIARAVRQGAAGPQHVPLIAATADTSVERSYLEGAGFDAVVHKPIDPRSMQSVLFAHIAPENKATRVAV
ncbi:MAG: ATP-binding protein [Pseudomonadota bacterium]